MLGAAEAVAVSAGHALIGLAVDPDEPANLRLYRRLGYDLWGHGEVVDEWTEHRDDGTSVHHADPSWHLLKELGERWRNGADLRSRRSRNPRAT